MRVAHPGGGDAAPVAPSTAKRLCSRLCLIRSEAIRDFLPAAGPPGTTGRRRAAKAGRRRIAAEGRGVRRGRKPMNSNTDRGQPCIKSSGMRSGPLPAPQKVKVGLALLDLELREGVEAPPERASRTHPPVISNAAKVVDARAISPRVAGRLKAGARDMVSRKSAMSLSGRARQRAWDLRPASKTAARQATELNPLLQPISRASRSADGIRHDRSTASERLLGANRRIARRLMFDLGVKFRAE